VCLGVANAHGQGNAEAWGGTGLQQATAVSIDAQGNAWVVGYTDAANFPTLKAAFAYGGRVDAFIVEISPSGNVLLSTYLGGAGDDRAAAVGLDADGNVYVAGTTTSTSFDGVPLSGYVADSDGFIVKLDPTAHTILYAVAVGGSLDDFIHAMAVRSDGTVVVAGETYSSNLPVTSAVQPTLLGSDNAFAAELNPSGGIVYCTYIGGSASDAAWGIAVDSGGSAWVVGSTTSTNFPLASPLQSQLSGSQEAFVVKLAANGASFLFSTYFGGSGGGTGLPEFATAVALDSSGNAYVAGVTSSANFPVLNAWQAQFAGWNSDAFLSSFTPGGTLRFSTYLGGSDFDLASSVAILVNGSVLLGGYTLSSDFPVTTTAIPWDAGGYNGFVTVFDSLAMNLLYSTYLNQGTSDSIFGVAGGSSPIAVGITTPQDAPSTTLATAAQLSSLGAQINPTGATAGAASGSGSVSVIAISGWTWTAASNAAWLGIVSGSSGTGNGTVSYSVAANVGTTSLVGTLTIGGQTFTVTQAGVALLSVTSTHAGNFTQGESNASYTVTVSDSALAGPTAGTVTVTDTLPTGMTLASMTGTGWTCASNSCCRNDALNPGAGYPAITVTVNVAWNAPAQVTNQVSVSGGGSASAGGNDPTIIGVPAGTYDFEGNGQPDLVWQNDTTGQLTVWYMGGAQGATFQGWNYLSGPVPGWKVVGTADFNGDGQPDLVWQNETTGELTVWYMGGEQGNTFLGWNYLSGPVAGWTVVAVADFNGDGHPDLVWQNATTGQVTVWYMGGAQGNTFLGWNYLSGTVPGWKVVGAADFNGDGTPDLIWQNDTARQVTVWYMGGAQGETFLGWNYLSSGVAGWTVVGAADFNGDGTPDLIWQNDTSRQVTVWYMGGAQGSTFLGWNYLSSSGVPGWTVVAP
jgi:uncharacterized repeat protein (TIGR01451 family)